jgi:WD40 repeat protein
VKRLIFISLIFNLLLLSGGIAEAQEQQYFGKNKVQYTTFDWYYIQTEHFDIYFYKGADLLSDFAAEALENAYNIISDQLNYSVKKRIPVIIYNSPNEFQQTNVIPSLIEEGVGGFTEVFKNRIVVPFNGSYEDFRHVLHHELTHAVTFDMLYGNVFRSLISSKYLFRMPLWFAEGYAEYSSRFGWDTFADMYMRDATIHGYITPLEYAGGFLVYKEGQSAIMYIVEKYGEDKIPEILSKGRIHLTMDKALKASIGKNMQEFDEEWMLAMRKEYWPEIAIRTEPSDIAKPLTDHIKDKSYYNEKPEFAPSGDRLAFFSDRSSYPEILIISTIDGAIIEHLIKGAKSAEYESFHTYQSGLSWSPDSKDIAFVSKSNGSDRLNIIDVDSKDVSKKFKFEFDLITSPDYSPDGRRIIFSAVDDGRSDLYLTDVRTGQLTRLTDDSYDDKEPDFFLDGNAIVFTSDRPAGDVDDTSFHYGNYNIFRMELATGRITSITDTTGINTDPAISPDGNRICFVSDRNGIYNLYIKELPDGETIPITDALSGCFSPSWSPSGDQIAFSGFKKAGFDIFLMKKIKPVKTENGALKPTMFMAGDPRSIFIPDVSEKEEIIPAGGDQEKEIDYSNYVFGVGDSELNSAYVQVEDSSKTEKDEDEENEAASYTDSLGNYIKKKYKTKFTPDLVGGDLGYDTYYGFSGESYIAISDIFGDHNFYIYTNLGNFFDQSNVQVYYTYERHRINLGLGFFHSQNYYIDSYDRLFNDRVYGGSVIASRPFSKFTRLELTGMHLTVKRKFYDPPFDNGRDRALLGGASLIHDNVLWGITGPINGNRYALHYQRSFKGILGSNLDFQTIEFDYRRYFNIDGRYLFAFRLASAASYGDDPQEFYLGGTANWIGRDLKRDNIYGIRDIYFGRLATPLRGYKYYELSGDRYVLTNIELRYPFIDYFKMRFPLPMTLSYINGAIFYDMGAAWYDSLGYRGVTSENGQTRLKDLKAGFGFGARANLGIFVLKYDAAWKTNWNSISAKPTHYFSFGAEF